MNTIEGEALEEQVWNQIGVVLNAQQADQQLLLDIAHQQKGNPNTSKTQPNRTSGPS